MFESSSVRPNSSQDRCNAAQTLGGTHWSAHKLAEHSQLSPATAHRILQGYGCKLIGPETFKFSGDQEFDAEVADILGSCLDRPRRALVYDGCITSTPPAVRPDPTPIGSV